jgi:hypothetical protein
MVRLERPLRFLLFVGVVDCAQNPPKPVAVASPAPSIAHSVSPPSPNQGDAATPEPPRDASFEAPIPEQCAYDPGEFPHSGLPAPFQDEQWLSSAMLREPRNEGAHMFARPVRIQIGDPPTQASSDGIVGYVSALTARGRPILLSLWIHQIVISSGRTIFSVPTRIVVEDAAAGISYELVTLEVAPNGLEIVVRDNAEQGCSLAVQQVDMRARRNPANVDAIRWQAKLVNWVCALRGRYHWKPPCRFQKVS